MVMRIPLPRPSGEILSSSLQNLFDNLSRERLAREQRDKNVQIHKDQLAQQANQLAETNKYHQGLLGLAQNRENRAAGLQPLNLDLLKAKIQAENSLAKQRDNYNPRMGTGGQEELFFQKLVSKDNPQLGNDPNKVYEASNALRQKKYVLADGTKINPLSPASQASLDRLNKGTTYAGVATPLINAAGAEKELDTLNDYAQKGLEPYGTTYLNMNPDQIMDTFKSDEESQKKLGKFIAAQQLQFEISQAENRIALGQPGITSTQELMHRSNQSIDAKYPKLSYNARKEASKYFIDALKAGFGKRKEAGVTLSSVMNNKNEKSNDDDKDPLGIR